MIIFELAIALLLVGAVLSLWASRIGVPYPALLALAAVPDKVLSMSAVGAGHCASI
jgi:hypothetical protein